VTALTGSTVEAHDPGSSLVQFIGVSPSPSSLSGLCPEGLDYFLRESEICRQDYDACLSGEDEDGDFDLDDHCDSSYRVCMYFARAIAEDICAGADPGYPMLISDR